jgi:serine protease
MVGSGSPFNGDSSVAQTFTAPADGGTLSFWYRVVCTDSVTYDWATATLKDNVTGTTTTMLAKTCTNTGAWNSASATLVGSHSYTVTLIDRDDNYATDPTYTLYDDVAIGAPPPPPPPSAITNGGFESGLTGWTAVGSTGTSTTSHSGAASARVGSTAPFNGDSSLSQTFTAPAGATSLSFWYRVVCTDSVTYDWATVTLRDNTTGTTTTVLAKICTNTGAWVSKSTALVGSHSYTLTLIDHDDNYATDPTYTLFDDVSTQ